LEYKTPVPNKREINNRYDLELSSLIIGQ